MKKYISLDDLAAEIEKRYEYWREKEFNSHSIESETRMSECQHLMLLLNTLEVKEAEEEATSNDLEEAADNYVGHAPEIDEDLSCFIRRNAFIAGAQWKKEQMITKACVFLESTDFYKYYNREFIKEFKKAMKE